VAVDKLRKFYLRRAVYAGSGFQVLFPIRAKVPDEVRVGRYISWPKRIRAGRCCGDESAVLMRSISMNVNFQMEHCRSIVSSFTRHTQESRELKVPGPN
jgi:hypothetical protein